MLAASFGVMGGFMQPQGHMQVVVAMVDDHSDAQAALDRPRFRIYGAKDEGKVELESGMPPEAQSELRKLGHTLVSSGGYTHAEFGRGQIIQRDSATGVLCGGSDPRADGCAMTL
jgi:gamma-glutamyltranspeptidase/glutathione hydrolase